ncbi:MAG: zinc-finger domain-containing protein [Sneathiella sp.]|nr:MAG: zinc-finger domain-containing protein [Sneathiella sp.]
MQAVETIEVENSKVACDGGKAALGHPRVYLSMGDKGQVECPYCGRTYILKACAKAGGGH